MSPYIYNVNVEWFSAKCIKYLVGTVKGTLVVSSDRSIMRDTKTAMKRSSGSAISKVRSLLSQQDEEDKNVKPQTVDIQVDNSDGPVTYFPSEMTTMKQTDSH